MGRSGVAPLLGSTEPMIDKASSKHRQRRRNVRLALIIAGVAVLFYVMMFVTLSQG